MISKPEALEAEWGEERYCKALEKVITFCLISTERTIMIDDYYNLAKENGDAFELFCSMVLYYTT